MLGSANKSGLTIGVPSSTSIFPTPGTSTGFGNFGGTQATGFGAPATGFSTPATGFGASAAGFGTPATGFSTPVAGFGTPTPAAIGFGMTAAASSTPVFGQTTPFGQAAGFGQTAATSQPSSGLFGSAFGSAAASKPVGTATGFGASTFGQGFGASATPAAVPAAGSATGFPTLNFGTPASTAGLFGQQQPAAASTGSIFGGLGSIGQSTGASLSGGAAPGLNLFGTGGTAFNRGTTAPAGTGSSFAWGQQQQQQQPAAPVPGISELQQLCIAITQPAVFGDERDATLAKWNQLQASWGTGKAYFLQTAHPVDLKRQNPFCRFKAVGYSRMPQTKNEDGLVALTTSKTEKELLDNQQASVTFLSQLLGNDTTLSVCVESIRALPDGKTELTIYVIQRPPSGSARRVEASELYKYLMQPHISAQLSQGGVESIAPKVALSQDALELYLRNPPVGIDPRLWEQAKKDNPDPRNMLPVPMVGFGELRRRLKLQEQQSQLHRARLEIIQADMVQLELVQAKTTSRIEEYKRKHLDLSHRVLKVMAKQEVHRKMGFGITADEEQLRDRLDSLQYALAAPAQFRGRLQELLSQIHMQSHLVASKQDAYRVDTTMQLEIKQLLKEQQAGLQHLVQVVKDDLEDMAVLEAALRSPAGRPGGAGES